MARIELEDVYVNYFLRKRGNLSSLTERGAVGAEVLIGNRFLEVAALKGVSLTIRDGDRVGLIGINGSGKSTLLKLCAGALGYQAGRVTIEGKVSPQFKLGAGLQNKLSGRQNTQLKCLYMGVPQRSLKFLVEEVKQISGLGGYFELPIYSYSAGMRSRLVMSLLRLVRGDILVMDEWINAVDPSLHATVGGLQAQLIDRAKILLLASHSRRVLEEWVERLIWLDNGRVRADGPIRDVYSEYQAWVDARGSSVKAESD